MPVPVLPPRALQGQRWSRRRALRRMLDSSLCEQGCREGGFEGQHGAPPLALRAQGLTTGRCESSSWLGRVLEATSRNGHFDALISP